MSQFDPNQLAAQYRRQGQPSGWFEQLYAQANGRGEDVPWANLAPRTDLVEWLDREQIDGTERSALVIGCGLGDDAEELARRGFRVTAFDISATAIEWSRRRFPDSAVNYQAADLFNTPSDWHHSFDFVLEYFTIQALPPETNQQTINAVARHVAPEGTVLVICLGSPVKYNFDGPPWPLYKGTLDYFQQIGFQETNFEEYDLKPNTPVRRYRIEYFNPLGDA